MNYKKLNEVDIVESMSDSGFVLGVDENGGIKRVPKPTLGKIKTVNGVEPDENGNVEVSGGNKNLAGVGDTKFVQSYFRGDGIITLTYDIKAGASGAYLGDGYLGLGEVMLVNFDGTDYTCKVNEDDIPTGKYWDSWFGNYSIYDSTKQDTGEPFFAALVSGDGILCWWTADTSVGHTATCETGAFVTKLIPEEYLPCEKPTAITIPYKVEGEGYQTKIGGYTFYQVQELIAKGCSVSFLTSPEITGNEYTKPLLYTLSGACIRGSGVSEGFIFAAINLEINLSMSEPSISDSSTAVVGFFWYSEKLETFSKKLTLS